MSFWKALGKIGAIGAAPFTGGASLSVLPLIDAVGSAASAGSQAAASNRGTRLQALMDADQMRMAAAREQRASESDILRKLAQTAYLRQGGSQFKPSTQYSYSFAPRAASAEQMRSAGDLERELLRRMVNPMQLSDYGKDMKPGFWEKFGGIVGAGATGLSAAMQRRQDQPPTTPPYAGPLQGTTPLPLSGTIYGYGLPYSPPLDPLESFPNVSPIGSLR
jgi:hypothetical protein